MNWEKKESVLTLKGAALRQVSVEARTPQSIPVTYNKTKTRGKHVRPKDNPGSWVWYSDFKSLYTFEQKRLRPYQGPLSLMEDESLPLLVLWVCQRSSKVDWPTLYFKARSRRPLLKCAEMLPLVVSPSRRAVGNAKVSKELKRQGLPGGRLCDCGLCKGRLAEKSAVD